MSFNGRKADNKNIAPEAPLLEVVELSKSLGGRMILDRVSLTLAPGELKVLIGPSGGGKSTLLQCVNCLIPPDQGRVLLRGKNVAAGGRAGLCLLRQEVGMIFQDFNLFDHLTAEANVAVALRKVKGLKKSEALGRARHELERVGLGDKFKLYPAQLSGGQKQRVSIARALAMDPLVMLLDEPTSALDPELIGEVLNVILALAQDGMTMLMATHQIGFARQITHEILFMERGRIIERGRPADLLAEAAVSRTSDFCAKLNALLNG